jgi:hypothetical protein
VNLTFDETLSMVVSKELDAMALSVDIDKFYLSEGGDIKAIQKLDKENLLFQEANRLSLWLKIENDVR